MRPDSIIADDNIGYMLELAEIMPPGPFVEVGVYKGGSAWHLATLAAKQGRALHLFDTFTGIPHKSHWDQHEIGDFGDADFETVKAAIPDARFHVGVFPETLPGDLWDIAFAHIDCDQYRSIKSACICLWPRMAPGGIMLFDDYGSIAAANKAVDEFFGGTLYAPRLTPTGKAYSVHP